jgi:hypothetical protein
LQGRTFRLFVEFWWKKSDSKREYQILMITIKCTNKIFSRPVYSGWSTWTDCNILNQDYCLLGYNAVQSVESQPAFWRNMSPPSSGSNKPSTIPAWKQVASSNTSVDFQWTIQRYIPEDSTVHNYYCENLKSYINLSLLANVLTAALWKKFWRRPWFWCQELSITITINNM